MRGQGTSMRHAAGKLDCKVERKWKQAHFMMDVFPKERGHAAQGAKGFWMVQLPGVRFPCGWEQGGC